MEKQLKYFKEKHVGILFVILPKKDAEIYSNLKKIADVQVGIHTTCIVRLPGWKPNQLDEKGRLIRELKSDAGSLVNILYKVNLRLGGENLVLDSYRNGEGQLFTRETMILAAVVGSSEAEFNHYAASLRPQTSKMEKIEAFGTMVGERLDYWKKVSASKYALSKAQYPKRIVIFRDRVSEGQFQMIMQDEWPQIKMTIRSRYSENDHQKLPKVIRMCVLKRHSTRFFPVHRQDQDRYGNPLCGLVVDEQVTYKDAYDFYLQSHACIKGTARPAYYVVLVDEIRLPRDVVQQEIFEHCFLFGRCSKAICIHPAVRYADRACDRARSYLCSSFVAGNRANEVFDIREAGWTGGVHEDLANLMFFL